MNLSVKNFGRGFTIVELLIVIVVIAILASITVVAFNGIQDRANNAARISYARNALNLLHAYKAMNGDYPSMPDMDWSTGTRAACLGEGWPQLNGESVCWNIYTDGGIKGPSTFLQNDSVNQELSKISNLPDYPQTTVWAGSDTNGRPLNLNAIILVERPEAANTMFPVGFSLAYVLKGHPDSTNCGLSGALAQPFNNTIAATRCVVPLGT